MEAIPWIEDVLAKVLHQITEQSSFPFSSWSGSPTHQHYKQSSPPPPWVPMCSTARSHTAQCLKLLTIWVTAPQRPFMDTTRWTLGITAVAAQRLYFFAKKLSFVLSNQAGAIQFAALSHNICFFRNENRRWISWNRFIIERGKASIKTKQTVLSIHAVYCLLNEHSWSIQKCSVCKDLWAKHVWKQLCMSAAIYREAHTAVHMPSRVCVLTQRSITAALALAVPTDTTVMFWNICDSRN